MNQKVLVFTAVCASVGMTQAVPITLQNCGNTLTFAQAPTRVITTYTVPTELMLRLGLGNRIVGAADFGEDVQADLLPAYRKLPRYGKDYRLPREQTLSLRPQLVFDNQPDMVYDAGKGNATREDLKAAGAQIYSLSAKCAGGGGSPTSRFEALYADLRNFGKLFNVSARAEQIIAGIRTRAATVQRAVAGRPTPKVIMYSDGEGPINVYGPSPYSDVLRLANGENVFADLKTSYGPVSVEQMATRPVDVILVVTSPDQQQKSINYLKKAFNNSSAVRNGRVIYIPYHLINPGIRNIEGLEIVARALHPDAFKR